MADDGHGNMIQIPSMLIHKDDGAMIFKTLEVGNKIVLTLAWNIPHPDNIVEWQFWSSSDDQVAAEFKRDFDHAAEVLGPAAVMTPHYFIGNGLYAGCYAEAGQPLPCGKACTNSGRYCSLNSEEDEINGLSGALVIEENLRQICIYQALNATGDGLKWWNYIENFQKECKAFSKACADKVLAGPGVGLTAAAVQKCMDDSGTGPTTLLTLLTLLSLLSLLTLLGLLNLLIPLT
jgi:hypothetical protein